MSFIAWRGIGEKGERYPAWVRALDGKSGVYAIRRRGLLFTTVLYVGESHTGSLYKTLTRHFQVWHRGKKFWRGQYAPEQTDPGHTYERAGNIEVAAQVATKARAVELQAEWIRKLKPADNVALVEEEVPF
jgi:excinuclease UvrABC nuclease subunit